MSGSLGVFAQDQPLLRPSGQPLLQDLYLEAFFPRPRGCVFVCWTTAEYMELFCNPGGSVMRAIAEVEVGSAFSITAQRYGFPQFRIEGVYSVIDPPNRITCTWNYKSIDVSFESIVNFDLVASESGTKLRITQTGFVADSHREMQRRWWNEVLWRMSTLFR